MTIELKTPADWALAIGILCLFTALVIALTWEVRDEKDEPYAPTREMIKLMHSGAVFAGLWTMGDLKRYASELGVYFTIEDYANIIKCVKDNFKIDDGINREIIVNCMKLYIAACIDRDFKMPSKEAMEEWHSRLDPEPEF